jgi:hypothetical protein
MPDDEPRIFTGRERFDHVERCPRCHRPADIAWVLIGSQVEQNLWQVGRVTCRDQQCRYLA